MQLKPCSYNVTCGAQTTTFSLTCYEAIKVLTQCYAGVLAIAYFRSTDITQKGLAIGSSVTVRIDQLRTKAAKLSVGLSDNSLFFMLMMGVGVFLIIIGGVQYDPNDFNIALFDDWFTLAFIVFGGGYLYVKLSPMFGFLKHNPLYMENAEEVDDR